MGFGHPRAAARWVREVAGPLLLLLPCIAVAYVAVPPLWLVMKLRARLLPPREV